MKYKIFFCLMVIALLLSSCNQQSNHVRIGVIRSSLAHYPLSYALEKGWLDKEDYSVIQYDTGKEASAALVSGRVDMAILPFTYAWKAASRDYPVKIVSFFERESEAIIIQPDIISRQDLNGKKVGMIKGSSQDILWQDFTYRENIDCEEMHFATPDETIIAMERRVISAAVLYVPLVDKLSDSFQVMHWFDDSYSGYPSSDLVVNTSRLKDEKGELIRMLKFELDDALKRISIRDMDVRNFLKLNYSLGEFQLQGAMQHTRFSMGLDKEGKVFERDMARISQESGYVGKMPSDNDVYLDLGADPRNE